LDEIRLADGGPLPPSIHKLLAAYGPHREVPGSWDDESLAPMGVMALIERAYPADFRAYFDFSPIAKALPGRCHWLGQDDPWRFLYVGKPDEWGEYPVLVLHAYDDVAHVVVEYPGFDVFFACRLGVIPSPRYIGGIVENPVYGRLLRAA